MTIQQVYNEFLYRINGLNSNIGQGVGGLGAFVSVFNQAQYSLVNQILARDEATDVEVELLSFLLKEVELTGAIRETYNTYNLPENFEHYKSGKVEATKGTCSHDLEIYSAKAGSIDTLYNDEMYGPSFEYEQTLGLKVGTKYNVYRKDFSLGKLTLLYYTEPPAVDIEGYTQDDNSASTNIDPIFTGRALELILDQAFLLHKKYTNS